jgi:uncharacterized protein (PEP-CTERM system associated)
MASFPLGSGVPWLCLTLAGNVLAQGDDGTKRAAWSIVPRVTAAQTFSDNIALSNVNRQSDLITELSPGVRLQANTARLKAYVDYSLRNYLSAKESGRDRTQSSLNSFATLEGIEKWLYLDVNASITQQVISAFGPQSVSTANTNANSTQVSNLKVSPYVKGRLGVNTEYNVRLSHSETRSQSVSAANLTTDELLATVSGVVSGPLGWTLDASSLTNAYSSGVKSEVRRAGGKLSYRFNPEYNAFVSAGAESNNYASANNQSYSNFGYGGDWTPSERTKLSLSRERRSFGDSHSISFSHRTPLTSWKFTDSRSATATPNQSAATGQGTYYDLLYSQLAATTPDPAARAQQVNSILQQSGIAPTAAITSGFLSSRVSIQRRQELSMVLNGLRNTATYTLFQTDSQSIGATTLTGVPDDFSRSTAIKTRGMSSNLSHRLTPVFSLNALSSWSRVSGMSTGLTSTQKLFNFNVSGKLSPRVTASVGLRRVVSEGDQAAYRENAVLGSLSAQF